MQYLWLVLVVVLCSLQSVTKKQYNVKYNASNAFLFSAITTFFAILVFVVIGWGSFSFNTDIIPYAVGFALSHGSASLGLFLAIKYGSLSITMLVSSYSLVIPTLYGIIALGEELKAVGYVGIVLLFISLFLIRKKDNGDKKKGNLKWIFFLILAFAGNGMCSTVQKMQQLAFDSAYKNEFMIVALSISTAILFIASFYDRKSVAKEFVGCIPLGAATGLSNGITNYLVMVLTGLVPTAILFPIISAGGIALGFVLAVTVYKERLSELQLVGYALGVISVVLLNI